MYGRQRSAVFEPILWFLSLLYRAALFFRSAAFSTGLIHSRRLPVPVVSVGNITLGGTGKTPMVLSIAKFYAERGIRPVILSRGYGRNDESAIEIVSDGDSVLRGAGDAGDEPAMLAARLPGVPVVVGSDRYRAGMLACERFHAGMALLDDGFQHRRVHRDLNILLVDALDPFGNCRLFPAGILREPLRALRRSDAVVITNADRVESLAGLTREIGRHTGAPILTARYTPSVLVDLASGETRPNVTLRGARVFAFAGVARPESFFSTLRALGARVTSVRSYPDHYRYVRTDLAGLFQAAVDSNAVMIVTTEKDAVRLKDMAPEGIWALRVDLEVCEKDAWERMLQERI
jgi:tetraacyldisaccharide 4'-kinase